MEGADDPLLERIAASLYPLNTPNASVKMVRRPGGDHLELSRNSDGGPPQRPKLTQGRQ